MADAPESSVIPKRTLRDARFVDVLFVYVLALSYILYGGFAFNLTDNKWIKLLFPVGLGLIPVLYCVCAHIGVADTFPIRIPSLITLAGSVVLMLGIFIIIVVIAFFIGPYLPVPDESNAVLQIEIFDDNVLYSLLAIAVLPAIFEEILCRGFLLSGLSGQLPAKGAIILCSAFFACLHFDLARLPFTFLAGLALSYAALVSKSLLIPVFMHFLYNFSLFLFVRFGSFFEDKMNGLVEFSGDVASHVGFDFILIGLAAILGTGLLAMGRYLLLLKTPD